MPSDFVARYPQLADLETRLAEVQDFLEPLGAFYPPSRDEPPSVEGFKAKDEGDDTAVIKGGIQRRSRHHERLVRLLAEHFQSRKIPVSTGHPRDLVIASPEVIFEAKIVGARHPGHAIREAVGQLHEYRHFLGPKDASLCIVLDRAPTQELVDYVEDGLGFLLLWLTPNGFCGAARTLGHLRELGFASMSPSIK